mmetsp:Transcript_27162/g.36295  ORF Transcript_27162/g.36295 Transcript_27162/m.36295 type:complete len:159 (-) Transcript_27162:265-741(-)|eukprot:CAMPEP_0185596426 /NCGR_PEP_ID=MMETSP0434-20130131/80751_1 /TAXON_ID=626734 ORGANISM="Favella taraikaensis, Strain Fe Narragansett Bay" /NCGR_SAMPLE_ID=MMETSP0434 /ASSEMBLY_ACC=CAM_ASM_000379 /LENGTH=158 /DNA_ID=CAMNT_0028224929 /DNA_START=1791 /DNA_END=2267 /DNA_ORIENTATION=+
MTTTFEIVTSAELFAVATVLLRDLAHSVILRAQGVQQTVAVAVAATPLHVAILVMEGPIAVLLDCARARVALIASSALLIVVYEVIVCESQGGRLEVTLLPIGVHQVVHVIQAVPCASVQELSSAGLTSIVALGASLVFTVSDLELRLLTLFASSLLA